MTDIKKELDHIESLKNSPFSYNNVDNSFNHINERLGGVLTDGIKPYHTVDDGRYPETDSLKTIIEKFDDEQIGLNSVPVGNEVKFRNAVLSEIETPHIGNLESMSVGPLGLDVEGCPELSGVTVAEVDGRRGLQKFITKVRFTRGYGIQTGKQQPNIKEGLLKSEIGVFLEVCRLNSDANKLTQGGNSELDGVMTPQVVIITPNPDNLDDREGVSVVMENTGMPAISYMREMKIIS